MIMESKRLFVGNIPSGVTEEDLRNEFNAYGSVKNVDLKSKINQVDPENPIFFAFISLEASDNSIKQCIGEFSQEKYRGQYLNVSVARESFLERLKRERKEAGIKKPIENKKTGDTPPIISRKNNLSILSNNSEKDRHSSSSSSSSDDDEEEENRTPKVQENIKEDPEIFLEKKNASTSMQNGKIKIKTGEIHSPIHIINKKEKTKNILDDRGKLADDKRKKSMNKMKNEYTKQKLAIQQALAGVVDSKKPKKIIFDNEEFEDEKLNTIPSKKIKLFDADENNDYDPDFETNFEIKEQFQGVKGQKLLKLQSKFGTDSRFKMDTKFINDDENSSEEENLSFSNDNSKATESNELNDERQWQLGIIEQVIGRKFQTLSEPNRKKLHKTMLRYDPTKEEHKKFVKNIEKVTKNIKKSKHNDIDDVQDLKQQVEEKPEIEVSKEQFFKINDDLANSLKRRGDGFSLLSMFGRSNDNNHDENSELFEKYEEKVLVSKTTDKQILNAQGNPFKFDSSDSENDEVDTVTNSTVNKKKNNLQVEKENSSGKTTKTGVWIENFFMLGNDKRLTEGAEFFKAVKKRTDGETNEDYDQVKNKLRMIINKKISKTKKSIHGNNLVMKKKFKRKK